MVSRLLQQPACIFRNGRGMSVGRKRRKQGFGGGELVAAHHHLCCAERDGAYLRRELMGPDEDVHRIVGHEIGFVPEAFGISGEGRIIIWVGAVGANED